MVHFCWFLQKVVGMLVLLFTPSHRKYRRASDQIHLLHALMVNRRHQAGQCLLDAGKILTIVLVLVKIKLGCVLKFEYIGHITSQLHSMYSVLRARLLVGLKFSTFVYEGWLVS